MKKTIIFLIPLISVLLFACSKDDTPSHPNIEPGSFKGQIGKHGYDLINDKSNERISTNHFNGENIQFHFYTDISPTDIDGIIHELDQKLTVNLVDPINNSKISTFETYNNSSSFKENWIKVAWFEKFGDKKTDNLYITIKGKKTIEAEILSINYKDFKVPSLEVKLKGYLYNIENKKDSIFIDAVIKTQAIYK